MTKRLVGGYTYQAEVTRAINSNRMIRELLRRILDEKPGPQTMAMLLARAATALGENLDALVTLQEIGRGLSDGREPGKDE
jgi:hypothetical protein